MKKIAQGDLEAILAAMPDPRKKKRSRRKRLIADPFPDYGRSLVTQHQSDPTSAGALRGLGYGTAGAVLAAAIAKMTQQDNQRAGLAALLGGLLGGGAGFYSGKKDQESKNTKLLFLRRLGIDNPGELEAIEQNPNLVYRLTAKGVKI